MKKLLLLCLMVVIVFPDISPAATYYMAVDGSDGNTGATDSRWLTFSHAFGSMSAGDTLVLGDGTYTTATNGGIDITGTNSGQPPDGVSKANPTTIISENGIGNVTIDNRLYLGSTTVKSSYVKIVGIRFNGISRFYNTNYCYAKNCFFYSTTRSVASVFGVGTNDHANGNTYNLVEDFWVDGEERIGAINYNSDHNVWRRGVIRMNGSDYSGGNPSVGITVYSSQYISVQNVIVLDREQDAAVIGQDFAGVQADPAGDFGTVEWLGCITISSDSNGWGIEPAATLEGDDYTFKIVNCVAIDAVDHGFGIQGNGLQHDVLINHVTAINNTKSGIRAIPTTQGTSLSVSNSISINNDVYGVYIDNYASIDSQYNQAYGNALTPFTPSGSNNSATDPGMQYIVRPGVSAITGNDATDVGASILYRYGTSDGLFYGDAGYNTISSNKIWPWPNEQSIKAALNDISTRGFCASTQTLTAYILNYLSPSNTIGVTGTGDSAETVSADVNQYIYDESPASNPTASGLVSSGVTFGVAP